MFHWITKTYRNVLEWVDARLWRAYTYPEKSNEELLFQAAEENRLDWVKHLVSLNVDLNHRRDHCISGATALHIAALKGNANIVRYLLSLPKTQRPDISALDKSGHTPLYYAISMGITAESDNFFNLSDEEKPDLSKDKNIVLIAVEKGNLNALRKMAAFPEAKRPNFKTFCYSAGSLFKIAARYPVELFQFLYELPESMRPEMNMLGYYNINVLQEACVLGNLGVIHFLLTHDDTVSLAPRVAQEQRIYINAFLAAAQNGNLDFIKFMLELDVSIRPDITQLRVGDKPLIDEMRNRAQLSLNKATSYLPYGNNTQQRIDSLEKLLTWIEEYKKSHLTKKSEVPVPLPQVQDALNDNILNLRPKC